jgi:hypothetical protein
MKVFITPARRLAVLLLTAAVMVAPYAQQTVAQEAAATGASEQAFSQQDLDEILAPIALYPDALLAQVLMASTYPMEIVEAARWQRANPDLKDKALEEALEGQNWDPAVKAITAVPEVLTMMDEKLDWTQKLGDAFLAQQEDVMTTVQQLRTKAKEAGNLKSTEQQTVKTEQEASQTVVIIESAKPEVVYVPAYNPATIYGPWWYPYPPPYYYYPPGYVVGVGLWFTAGVIVGNAIWGGCHWGRNEININVNRYNSFNKTNIKVGDWRHNPDHRKGVAYRDQATARKFDRGGDRAAAKSREQVRGRAEQGRAELKSMDRGKLESQVRTADRKAGSDLGSRVGDKPGAGASRDLGSRVGDKAGTGAGRDLGSQVGAKPGTGASRDLGARVGDKPSTAASRDLGSRAGGGSSKAASRDLSSRSGSARGGGFSGAGGGASQRAASARGSASFGGGGGRSIGGGGRGGGRR